MIDISPLLCYNASMKKAVNGILEWILTGPKITVVALVLTVIGVNSRFKEMLSLDVTGGIIVTAFAVGIFGFVVSIMKCVRADKGKQRILKIAGTVAIPFLGATVFLGSIALQLPEYAEPSTSHDQTHTVLQTSQAKQEPEILSALQSVEAKYNYSKLNLVWTDNPEADCGSADARGCYNDHRKTIKISKYLDRNVLRSVVAHEYLHYVWYSEKLDDNNRLTSELIALYAKYPAFQKRVDGDHGYYRTSGGLLPTEFFSYGCTEISGAKLGEYILTECNRYINTNLLPTQF